LGTGSVSWFESNAPGCKPIFKTNITLEDPFRPIRPDRVDGCLLDYPIVEVILSSVQMFLAVSQLARLTTRAVLIINLP
jgi:sodium/potassium-transporting ATPase subunit beta-1-interacting protein